MSGFDRFRDSTSVGELLDSLNYRGVPGTGGRLPSQAGTRGSPRIDPAKMPGVELLNQTPRVRGNGTRRGVTTARATSGERTWAVSSNLDRSVMLTWVAETPTTGRFVLAVMLLNETDQSVTADDVFGGTPSHLTLVAQNEAWRITLTDADFALGDFGPIFSHHISEWQNRWDYGSQISPSADRYGSGWLSGSGANSPILGSRFSFNPDEAVVYQVCASANYDRNETIFGLGRLWSRAVGTSASLMIYDFTLKTQGGDAVVSEMPLSASGATGDYISDIVELPPVEATILARAQFERNYRANVGQALAIPNVPGTAFITRPDAEDFSVVVTPPSASLTGASYTYGGTPENLSFVASAAGEYNLTFTGVLTDNLSAVVDVPITIVVT